MERKLILYIAMSLDGFIADRDGNLDFLKTVEIENEDYGHSEFIKTIDIIIWGRKTYDKILSFGIDFPYKDKRCIVISKTKTGKDNNVEFYNGELKELIEKLKTTAGKDIYCDGGGDVVYELLRNELFDKLIISVIPCLLGDGIRLFKGATEFQGLTLISVKKFKSGLVQLEYNVNKTL